MGGGGTTRLLRRVVVLVIVVVALWAMLRVPTRDTPLHARRDELSADPPPAQAAAAHTGPGPTEPPAVAHGEVHVQGRAASCVAAEASSLPLLDLLTTPALTGMADDQRAWLARTRIRRTYPVLACGTDARGVLLPPGATSRAACPPEALAGHPDAAALARAGGCATSALRPGSTAGHESLWLGVQTNCTFYYELKTHCQPPGDVSTSRLAVPPAAGYSDHYAEWTDLLFSVATTPKARAANAQADADADTRPYVMAEIGAGWGKWAADAYWLAVAATGGRRPVRLVALEGQASHCDMLAWHLATNGIDPDAHDLYCAVAGDKDGALDFPQSSGGNFGANSFDPAHASARRRSPALSLVTLLSHLPRIDLLDVDIQGHELGVLRAAAAFIDARVALLHVATHNHFGDVETPLTELFVAQLGWEARYRFPWHQTSSTPWGPLRFEDGVLTFRNPKL
jgi:FkbM family methyltransferase